MLGCPNGTGVRTAGAKSVVNTRDGFLSTASDLGRQTEAVPRVRRSNIFLCGRDCFSRPGRAVPASTARKDELRTTAPSAVACRAWPRPAEHRATLAVVVAIIGRHGYDPGPAERSAPARAETRGCRPGGARSRDQSLPHERAPPSLPRRGIAPRSSDDLNLRQSVAGTWHRCTIDDRPGEVAPDRRTTPAAELH